MTVNVIGGMAGEMTHPNQIGEIALHQWERYMFRIVCWCTVVICQTDQRVSQTLFNVLGRQFEELLLQRISIFGEQSETIALKRRVAINQMLQIVCLPCHQAARHDRLRREGVAYIGQNRADPDNFSGTG